MALAAAAGIAAACDGGTGSPEVPPPEDPPIVTGTRLTIQEAIDVADFEALASEHPELQTILATMGALASAGQLENDDGKILYWGEEAQTNAPPSTAIVACDPPDDCRVRKHVRVSSGLIFSAPDGSSAPEEVMGEPALLRNLEGHSLSNATSLATGALQLDPAALPTVDFENRRCVLLNTYGSVLNIRMNSIRDTVVASGGFHEVDEVTYAREADVLRELETLDGLDAMVWLTQSVREEVKSPWTSARTVGVTVNRGGFGETLFSRDDFTAPWAANVAGGPGLIILAASQSQGDGSAGQPDNSSLWSRLMNTPRVLVGIQGSARAPEILDAVQAFLGTFLSGSSSLGEALSAGTTKLSGGAELVSNQVDLEQTWLRSWEAVWDDVAFLPSSVQAQIPITATPYCAPPGQARTPATEGHTQPFADVTFDGAYFKGERTFEGGGLSVQVHLQGVVSGFQVDDKVLFEVYGDFDADYRGYHAFGEGRIREVETTDDGSYIVHFDGPAHTAPFENADGESCILNNPQISTTTSVRAKLVMKP